MADKDNFLGVDERRCDVLLVLPNHELFFNDEVAIGMFGMFTMWDEKCGKRISEDHLMCCCYLPLNICCDASRFRCNRTRIFLTMHDYSVAKSNTCSAIWQALK